MEVYYWFDSPRLSIWYLQCWNFDETSPEALFHRRRASFGYYSISPFGWWLSNCLFLIRTLRMLYMWGASFLVNLLLFIMPLSCIFFVFSEGLSVAHFCCLPFFALKFRAPMILLVGIPLLTSVYSLVIPLCPRRVRTRHRCSFQYRGRISCNDDTAVRVIWLGCLLFHADVLLCWESNFSHMDRAYWVWLSLSPSFLFS